MVVKELIKKLEENESPNEEGPAVAELLHSAHGDAGSG